MTNLNSRLPTYLTKKQIPDKDLLRTLKKLIKERKSRREIIETAKVTDYTFARYFWKIRRGVW